MSSHVLSEVERVCDRLAVLREGELVLVSSVIALRQLAGRRLRATFAADVEPPPSWPEGTEVVDVSARTWSLRAHGPIGPLVELLSARPVEDLDVQVPTLEELLRKYYAREGES
jgi:ABC-2 type transport system ATP-binding protein